MRWVEAAFNHAWIQPGRLATDAIRKVLSEIGLEERSGPSLWICHIHASGHLIVKEPDLSRLPTDVVADEPALFQNLRHVGRTRRLDLSARAVLSDHRLPNRLNLSFVVGDFGRDISTRHRGYRHSEKNPPGNIIGTGLALLS